MNETDKIAIADLHLSTHKPNVEIIFNADGTMELVGGLSEDETVQRISKMLIENYSQLHTELQQENARLKEAIVKLSDHQFTTRCENIKLRDLLKELVDIVDAVREGEYTIDSFTLQPAKAALKEDGS